ncbi:MAG: hypothetical protein IPH96_16695 [Saprospiraceae bacterium]|nr:hypothetical protein [Saprospiraceae bacterium]
MKACMVVGAFKIAGAKTLYVFMAGLDKQTSRCKAAFYEYWLIKKKSIGYIETGSE